MTGLAIGCVVMYLDHYVVMRRKGAARSAPILRPSPTIRAVVSASGSPASDSGISSYALPGSYAVDFVCHTVTERVLRALEVGTARFSSQVRTYPSARWVWGPQLPSFHSHAPEDWAVSRSCGS